MNPNDTRLKGLFVVEADEQFGEHHPLWATIASFRSLLAETHVVVFVKGKVPREQRIIEREGGFFVYQVPIRFFSLNFSYYWATIQFNLHYRKVFRPDFVCSFADALPAGFGYLLAWSNKRCFFMQGSTHLLGQTVLSPRYMLNKFLLKRATAVFVPGKQTAALFTDLFTIPPAQLITIETAFDHQRLAAITDKRDFRTEHPQYTFFISSVIYTLKDVHTLIALHSLVRTKYPRTAMVLLVPSDLRDKIEQLLKRQKAFGMFVYAQDDAVLTAINGTQLYVAISREQDIDTMMVTALGLLMPVVATTFGIAPELFTGTPYQSFMTAEGDIEAMSKSIFTLIEDQRLRAEYSVNAGMLLSKVKFATTDDFTRAIFSTIKEVIQPTLQKIKAVPDLPAISSETKPPLQ